MLWWVPNSDFFWGSGVYVWVYIIYVFHVLFCCFFLVVEPLEKSVSRIIDGISKHELETVVWKVEVKTYMKAITMKVCRFSDLLWIC